LFLLSHGYVPNEFGYGVIVPVTKDKSADLNSSDNYRPITLIPIISKVFESVLLTVCEDSMLTNDLQFGFKFGVGCPDAIFLFKATVGHFVSNGSCVFSAALDIRKAFDAVNHLKMFSVLISKGIPLVVIDVLRNWYSKLCCVVRWHGVFENANDKSNTGLRY